MDFLRGGEVHLLSTKPMPWRQWHLQLHFSRRGQSEFQRMGFSTRILLKSLKITCF